MITRAHVLTLIPELRAEDLDQWIARAWVRPDDHADTITFAEMDVARIRLLVVLRIDLALDPDVVPVVLSLLDQLHDARRQLLQLRRAIDDAAPDRRAAIADRLRLIADV